MLITWLTQIVFACAVDFLFNVYFYINVALQMGSCILVFEN